MTKFGEGGKGYAFPAELERGAGPESILNFEINYGLNSKDTFRLLIQITLFSLYTNTLALSFGITS
jgi:hypothetical protein